MKIVFLTGAKNELREAIFYYNKIESGLGVRLRDNIYEKLAFIHCHPEAFPCVIKNIRKCNCRKFPYSIYYIIEDSHIKVIAVAHQKRGPGYWKKRLE